MGKKKKNSKQDRLLQILILLTALTNLIVSVLNLIEHLL